MKKIISTERKPIKMWLDDMEDGALDQAKNLANLPFIHKHVAIMPDSHRGYGMPIGGVIATENVVIPNAVGVDIGCGMCAVKTSLTEITTEDLKKIMSVVRKMVPLGFKKHKYLQPYTFMPDGKDRYKDTSLEIVCNEFRAAQVQLGTLGGGNHFIEIQKGDDGHIWIMIHSGSRNLGYTVAKHYNNLAVTLNAQWLSQIPKEWGLAFLPRASEYYNKYLDEMEYCVKFALANREHMMLNTKAAFTEVLNGVTFEPMINIAHNYAQYENHFGKNVLVHRKGATSARKGELGIIPGSQGTCSYIVEGLGNPESFNSCSHGAGRLYSRSKARTTLNLDTEMAKLDAKEIVHSLRRQDDLDEAPGAYKDIDKVMANQADLVKILVKLEPLAVIKG